MSAAQTTNAVNAVSPPSVPSYVVREINASITLGQGTFGQTASNAVTLTGLRIVANIQKRGLPSMDQASIRIYGLTPALMNQLSTLGVLPTIMARPNNSITLQAGDAINGMSTVFSGPINRAYQKLGDAPETFFQLDCWSGFVAAMQPNLINPTSTPGPMDVATIMQTLAKAMGFGFENNGVQVKLPPSYYPGTAFQQMQDIANDANITAYIDSATSPPTLVIAPKGVPRGGQVPLISANSGLILYPEFEQWGIAFRCIFNPNIKFLGQVQINSTLYPPSTATAQSTEAQQQAAGPNGFWYIASLNLNLASQVPDGPWFCECQGTRTATQPVSA